MTPRLLTAADVDAVAFVHRVSFNDRIPWLKDHHTPAEDRDYFGRVVFRSCNVWGVHRAGELAGFVAVRPGWIDQFYVLPHFQRQGIGHCLLLKAQEREDSLELFTFQKNTAGRRFYEQQGFIAGAMTDGENNEEKEPDVLYRWDRPV